MGKIFKRAKRTKAANDPIMDHLAVVNARTLLISNLIGMGWRLALVVLVPIFAGVQLDKRFDSAPSLTLAAFFIAIFAASMLIYKTYVEMSAQAASEEAKKAKRRANKVKRETDV